MALIDSSYFVGPINIPNTATPEVSERLAWFIDKYEADFLDEVFGYELATAFEAGIEDYDPDGSNPTIDAKWLALLEGGTYIKDGRVKKFKGLMYERGSSKFSMIANYVYWYWIKDQHSQTVGLGEVNSKSENAENTNPAVKMIRAWNEMCEEIYSLYCYLYFNESTYQSSSSVTANLGSTITVTHYQYKVGRGDGSASSPIWADPEDGDVELVDERINGLVKSQLLISESGYGNKLDADYSIRPGGGIILLNGKTFDQNVVWVITATVSSVITVAVSSYPGFNSSQQQRMLRRFRRGSQNLFGF